MPTPGALALDRTASLLHTSYRHVPRQSPVVKDPETHSARRPRFGEKFRWKYCTSTSTRVIAQFLQ